MKATVNSREESRGSGESCDGRILLIEPDADRARRLTRILSRISAALQVVQSTGEGVRAIRERVPDLVLTTTFLPPTEEAAIRAQLSQVSAAAHVQIVSLPPFIREHELSDGPPKRVLTFLGRGARALGGSPCDAEAVIEDITAYLEQSRGRRAAGVNNVAEPRAHYRPAHPGSRADHSPALPAGPRDANDRRRARRRLTGELPWLATVQLPWGTEVKVLDISKSGVLLESPLRLVVGSTLDLQLVGQDGQVRVSARLVRSEIADVNRLGVRYRAAAAFTRDLQIPGLLSDAHARPGPRALADLLSRVVANVDVASAADLRGTFERELRELLSVRDVRLRVTPVIESFGTESIVFAVPQCVGPSPVLQVTFHRDYQPSLPEFRLLKAAAAVAGVLLQFAPLDGAEAGALRGVSTTSGASSVRPIQSRW